MKTTLNWLKSYTDFDLSPEDLVSTLTMLGLEVDSLQPISRDFDGVVVGKVAKKSAHPNADRLSVCEVDVGSKSLTIVCGAPNVEVDQTVPVALEGTRLPNGMVIKSTSIRGVESHGMICSEAELGISSRGDGIMVLDKDVESGKKLNDVLANGDSIVDIDVSPNRPDCFGAIGIARDLAAVLGTHLTRPEIDLVESSTSISELITVNIMDPEKCPRYSTRFISNVEIKPSPWWLAQKLEAVGVRSLNNVVDVTNYVMMETGQPLHAFDYDLLRGQEINVKTASAGEKFTTLDNETHTLNSECLMICDGNGPVAIGGVMGGLNSEVSDNTKNILLESAHFDPVNVRRTSKFLGISTEASRRFERGVDPNGTIYALDRAAQLIAELSGGEIAKGRVDVYPKQIAPETLKLRVQRVERLLGVQVPSSEIKLILEKLGFQVEDKGDLAVTVPTFRPDITREADLIEEVARVFGYDNIPADATALIQQGLLRNSDEEFTGQISRTMLSFGFSEAVTYNLIHKKQAESFALKNELAGVINPISEDLSTLRPSLIPGLLRTLQWNINRKSTTLRLFEIGPVFYKNGATVEEETRFAGVLTGSSTENTWKVKAKPFDIFDIKGYVAELLARNRIVNYILESCPSELTNQKTLCIKKDGELLGLFGEISQNVLQEFDIDQPVFMFDFDLKKLTANRDKERKFKPIPKYPPSKRDLAVVVGETVKAEELVREIEKNGGEFLRNVRVFDVFTGEPVGEGKKSLAFNLTFYSLDRTLMEGEVESQIERILEALSARYSAKLRS